VEEFLKIKQFFRETWWLWTIYLVVCLAASWYISSIFLSALPMLVSIFFYFAIIRGPERRPWEESSSDRQDRTDSGSPDRP
jgi:hypothetical protein